jgi:hypothetical protein
MGSLTSRPDIPSQPQVIYMPAPVYTPPLATPGMPSGDGGSEETPDRSGGLLLRDRGRFGTVLTGFRGLLAPAGSAGGRKTLLGE